jgi:hypothetical protein
MTPATVQMVTIDRDELASIAVEVEALANFADHVYGGNALDSFLWHKLLGVSKRVCLTYLDETAYDADSSVYEAALARKYELLDEFVATISNLGGTATS